MTEQSHDKDDGSAGTLVSLSGLPGVGKTSIAKTLARLVGATFVRIDSIELALCEAGQSMETMDARGYLVGYAVARDNLRAGLTVIGDCLNPCPETRDAWRRVAIGAGARLLEVEVLTSWSTGEGWKSGWGAYRSRAVRRGRRLKRAITVRGAVSGSCSTRRR